jgi:hypothetical protein
MFCKHEKKLMDFIVLYFFPNQFWIKKSLRIGVIGTQANFDSKAYVDASNDRSRVKPQFMGKGKISILAKIPVFRL